MFPAAKSSGVSEARTNQIQVGLQLLIAVREGGAVTEHHQIGDAANPRRIVGRDRVHERPLSGLDVHRGDARGDPTPARERDHDPRLVLPSEAALRPGRSAHSRFQPRPRLFVDTVEALELRTSKGVAQDLVGCSAAAGPEAKRPVSGHEARAGQ